MLSREGGHRPPQGLQAFTWMRMPDEAAMDDLWTATFLHPSSRHLALMRTLRTAARATAPLLLFEEWTAAKLNPPTKGVLQ